MTRQPRDKVGDFLARVAPYIQSEGARNIGTIARDLGLPYQTVSFRMQHLKDLGISVIPVVQVERFGLTRFRASFQLGSQKIGDVKRFFTSLNESAGLRYYSKSLVKRNFDCEFNIPVGKLEELTGTFEELEKMNLVSGPSFHRILWKDFPMLNTSCFDYPGGEWDVDLSRLVGDPSVMLKIPSAEDFVPCSFDYKDLVITKELEIDPWAKVVEIARKIRCPIRDVSYHLNKHVLGRGLIDSFRIRWIGTQQAWAKHSIIGLTFVFNKIGDKDARHAISILTSVPFLWSHLRTDGGMYLAEILIPVSMFHETIQRISLQLVQVDLVPEILLPDWSCSSNYTIPYQLYDKTDKEWVLDGERIMANILEQHAIERRKA